MLALMLSGVVGLASLVFFGSAFFAPKLHRKDDFLWSGFGFFYALVLWVCAQRFTGAILLGQLAAVSLLLAFAWQTLRLRAAIANQAIAELPSFSLLDWLGGGLKRQPKAPPVQPKTQAEPGKEAVKSTPAAPSPVEQAAVAEEVVEKAVEKVDQVLATIDAPTPVVEAVEEIVETAIAATEAIETLTSASAEPESPVAPTQPQGTVTAKPNTAGDNLPKPKSKLFQWLFRGKKQQPSTPSSNIAAVIESIEAEDEDWGEEDALAETVTPAEETMAAVAEIIVEQGAETKATIGTETVGQAIEKVEETVVSAVEDALENVPEDGVTQEEPETPIPSADMAATPEITVVASAPQTEVNTDQAEQDAEISPAPPVVTDILEIEPQIAVKEDQPSETAMAPAQTVAEESNWEDLDQDFDPYLGGDEASTTIEQSENSEQPN